jgi:hypothetical protein
MDATNAIAGRMRTNFGRVLQIHDVAIYKECRLWTTPTLLCGGFPLDATAISLTEPHPIRTTRDFPSSNNDIASILHAKIQCWLIQIIWLRVQHSKKSRSSSLAVERH